MISHDAGSWPPVANPLTQPPSECSLIYKSFPSFSKYVKAINVYLLPFGLPPGVTCPVGALCFELYPNKYCPGTLIAACICGNV